MYRAYFTLLIRLIRNTHGSVIPLVSCGILMLVTIMGIAVNLSEEESLRAHLDSPVAKTAAQSNPNTTLRHASQAHDASAFMQIQGDTSYPVATSTLTKASIFYFGQGIGSGTTYLNPMTYNDPTTGLYSYATPLTADSAPPVANSTFSGNNSIVMRANGFDTISVVPGATVGAGHGTVNDVVIGNYTFTGGRYPEYGPALHFGGITSMGSDDFFLQRYNIAANESALILNMGDDYLSSYGGGGNNVGDVFEIGAQEGVGSTFVPNFQFTSDGHLGIGQFTLLATGTEEGDSTLEIASNWTGGLANARNGIGLEGNPADPDQLELGIFVDEQAAGSFNPLVQKHDHEIVAMDYTSRTNGVGNIFIGPWSNDPYGLYVTQSGNNGVNNNAPQAALDITGTGLLALNSGVASPRVGLVDLNLGTQTTAPAWYIDNNADSFRLYRQNSIGVSGTTFLTVTSLASPAVGGNFVFAGKDSSGKAQNVTISGGAGSINATGWLNGYNVQANASGGNGGNIMSDSTSYVQTGTGATSNSGTAVTIGTACSTKGAMAYDNTNNIIVYCNTSTNVWTSIGKPNLVLATGFPKRYADANGNNNGGSGSASYAPYDLCFNSDIAASPTSQDTLFEYKVTYNDVQKRWNFSASGTGSGFFATASCYNFQ